MMELALMMATVVFFGGIHVAFPRMRDKLNETNTP